MDIFYNNAIWKSGTGVRTSVEVLVQLFEDINVANRTNTVTMILYAKSSDGPVLSPKTHGGSWWQLGSASADISNIDNNVWESYVEYTRITTTVAYSDEGTASVRAAGTFNMFNNQGTGNDIYNSMDATIELTPIESANSVAYINGVAYIPYINGSKCDIYINGVKY